MAQPGMDSMRFRLIAAVAATVVALGAAGAYAMFLKDMQDIRARMAAEAEGAETRHGPVRFVRGGAGPGTGTGTPVLSIHGAGGGYDQGRLLAEAFLPDGVAWIAPSRFGYPGSPLPENPSTAAQADAFADLLDVLGVERVAILAMSGGVPPALQFATRHPERTAALILLSLAPYAPLTAEEQDLPVPLWLYNALFGSDFPYWAMLRVAPGSLSPLFDARPELRADMTAMEQDFLDAMIRLFLPVTKRFDGLRNEGAAIDPAATDPRAGITAPTLIVHARDDRITPFSTARFTADGVDGAELTAFDTGGHLLLGHHAEVRDRIAGFLSRHGIGLQASINPDSTSR